MTYNKISSVATVKIKRPLFTDHHVLYNTERYKQNILTCKWAVLTSLISSHLILPHLNSVAYLGGYTGQCPSPFCLNSKILWIKNGPFWTKIKKELWEGHSTCTDLSTVGRDTPFPHSTSPRHFFQHLELPPSQNPKYATDWTTV